MLKCKQLLIVTIITSAINSIQAPIVSAMHPPVVPLSERDLATFRQNVEHANERAEDAVEKSDQCLSVICSINREALSAVDRTRDTINALRETTDRLSQQTQEIAPRIEQAQTATRNLEQEYQRLNTAMAQNFAQNITQAEERLSAVAQQERALDVQDRIRIEQASIHEMQQQGVYEQAQRIQAQATINVEKEKWKNIHQILNSSKPIIKIVSAIIAIALGVYLIKHGMPMLLDYLTEPSVIKETSRIDWLDWFGLDIWQDSLKEDSNLDDLIFTPSLHKQLFDLFLRVQTAHEYDQTLPNVLFHGPSGTGKTAVAKILAYVSGFDYAITSGSEFAKDLKIATKELHNLLNWAEESDRGVIIFIDEAESLFANRNLSTTPNAKQDFINTFLSLISDQSQKNIMFIFVTNHPFKLDDAITNRIGTSIKFTLPTALEREQILLTYLNQFAKENNDAIVAIQPEVKQSLAKYVTNFEDVCPRDLKFMAEKMIITARRQEPQELTPDIVQAIVDEKKDALDQITLWKKEREKWVDGIKWSPNKTLIYYTG